MNQKTEFIQQVLGLYTDLPDTPNRFSRLDRALAASWFDQAISLAQIQQALILAQVRRASNSHIDPQLGPIRSLHYFIPILNEVLHYPPQPEYFSYVQQKLAAIKSRKPN